MLIYQSSKQDDFEGGGVLIRGLFSNKISYKHNTNEHDHLQQAFGHNFRVRIHVSYIV